MLVMIDCDSSAEFYDTIVTRHLHRRVKFVHERCHAKWRTKKQNASDKDKQLVAYFTSQ